MKKYYLFMIIIGATMAAHVYWYTRQDNDMKLNADLPGLVESNPTLAEALEGLSLAYPGIGDAMQEGDGTNSPKSNKPSGKRAPSGEITLIDIHGRTLNCQIRSKLGSHLLIQRSGDNQRFLLSTNQLSSSSHREMIRVMDFNENELREFALPQALNSVRVQVMTIPSNLNQRTERELNRIDAMKRQLVDADIPYETGWLQSKNLTAPSIERPGKKYYPMPTGIGRAPFILVGEKAFSNANSPDAIREAIVDAYLAGNDG